jgi:hypothetical protein
VTPAAASRLSIVTQPKSAATGSGLGPVTVKVVDRFGNAVPGTPVSLALSSRALQGTATVTTDGAGLAVFNNLSVPVAGTYTLTASAAGLTSVSSASFTVTPAGSRVSFVTQPPASLHAGTSFSPVVKLADAAGNPVAGVLVSLRMSAGALNGTLTTTTNAAGQAVFSNLSVNLVGSYTLQASVAGLPTASSTSFTVTPAAAARLAFVVQPQGNSDGKIQGPVTVRVVDALGNAVAGTAVILGISSGALQGTTTVTTNAAGLAVFSNLSVPAPVPTSGTFTLRASAAGLTNVLSDPFSFPPTSVHGTF